MTSDGVETIDVYKRYMQDNKPFDVVILDLTIQKGMDGAETIKKLLQIDPNVKYIISSGYASNEIMSNYEKYGFKECLEKPFTVTELANKLNKIMKK
jgi:DNA-binding NtrC family response regulator